MKSNQDQNQLDAKKKMRREIARRLTKYYDRATDYGNDIISAQFLLDENSDPEETADAAIKAIAGRYGLTTGSTTPRLPSGE